MNNKAIYLVGASGHGKVVLDALLQFGMPSERIVVTDDSIQLIAKDFLGLPIVVPALQVGASQGLFHVAIGDGKVRQRLFESLEEIGSQPITVLHPRATISRFVSIGPGSFVAAHAVIAPGVIIGRGTIINHGTVIDHDCVIGSFVHISPNSTLGGGVKIGDSVLVGSGATILPGTIVGDRAIIGAGAVVLKNIDVGVICAGVPAVTIGETQCD